MLRPGRKLSSHSKAMNKNLTAYIGYVFDYPFFHPDKVYYRAENVDDEMLGLIRSDLGVEYVEYDYMFLDPFGGEDFL